MKIPTHLAEKLTPFERKLCRLRASGLDLQGVADASGYKYSSVRVYFHKIYKKIGRQEINMLMIQEASQEPPNQRLTP